MKRLSISYTYKYYISFADNYVFTTCGLCVNLQTGRLIKKIYNSGSIGYNIKGKFYSLVALKKTLVKVKNKDYCPF